MDESFVRDLGMTPDEFWLLLDGVKEMVPNESFNEIEWDDEAFEKALGASMEVFADV